MLSAQDVAHQLTEAEAPTLHPQLGGNCDPARQKGLGQSCCAIWGFLLAIDGSHSWESRYQIQFVCRLYPFLDQEALLTVSHILVGKLQGALQGAALEDHLEIRAAEEFLQSFGYFQLN